MSHRPLLTRRCAALVALVASTTALIGCGSRQHRLPEGPPPEYEPAREWPATSSAPAPATSAAPAAQDEAP